MGKTTDTSQETDSQSHDLDSQSHDSIIKVDKTVSKSHDTDIENETSNDKQDIVKSDKTGCENEKVVIEIKEQSDSNETCDKKDETEDSENKNKHNTFDGQVLPTDALQEESDSEEESEDNEDDDDGDGWITPANIREVKQKMGDVNTEMANVAVGCLTTDFAIQVS